MTADATTRIQRIRVQLMLGHPYLAAAVARLPLVLSDEMEWCPTAATDGYHIIVNPDFIRSLSDAEGEFVLAHEILHCVLGHADRRGERDRSTWNQATDYATNQMLVEFGFALPPVGLFSTSFRGMTAEAIYETIRARSPAREPRDSSTAHGLAGVWATPHTSLTPDQLRRLVATGGWDVQLDAEDHEGSASRGRDMPTRIDRQRMRNGLAGALRRAAHGRSASFAQEEVTAGATARLSWEVVLARFVTGLRRSDYRTYPFNRKHLHRGVYLPALGAPGPRHLVVAIDTSGSITAETAAQLLAEIDALRVATECRLTLLEIDAALQRVSEFEPWDVTIFEGDARRFTIRGRGGTDFGPAFEWIDRNTGELGEPPDALIFLTDGFGTFPAREPSFPVIWVITSGGLPDVHVPFGAVMRLPEVPPRQTTASVARSAGPIPADGQHSADARVE